MGRTQKTGWVAGAGGLAIAIALAGCSGSAGKPIADDKIVAPSQYLEDIEDEGSVGGVEDEADSAEAQAEAAEAAAKAAAAKAKKKSKPTGGGW